VVKNTVRTKWNGRAPWESAELADVFLLFPQASVSLVEAARNPPSAMGGGQRKQEKQEGQKRQKVFVFFALLAFLASFDFPT
jgi:hypothetical protein